jgi:membrane associated rhomboid family serine protease
MSADRDEPPDWIETAVRFASSLGFNGMRVRWKLIRMQQSWQRSRRAAEQETAHLRYEHAVCPYCGRVQDRRERACVGCGKPMATRPWQMVQRLGVVMPRALSVSTLLGVLLLATYFRLMLARPGSGYLSADTDLLVHYGAYYLPAVQAGELWRYGTAIFLHIGLWHLGFNLLALAQIGPAVEETFGRGRMAFFFMLTGVLSFAACHAWGMMAVSAGASGAVMGLMGAAAGWGQRDGTGIGRAIRNQMLKWVVYVTLFGVLFNANHVAHFAGFLAGGLLGYLTPARWLRREVLRPLDVSMGALGLAAAALTAVLVVRPPSSAGSWMQAHTAEVEDADYGEELWEDDAPPEHYLRGLYEACALREGGQIDAAMARLRTAFPPSVEPEQLGPEQLRAHCESYERMVEFCSKPRDSHAASKLIARQWVWGEPQGPSAIEIEHAWDAMCKAIHAPRPASAPPSASSP